VPQVEPDSIVAANIDRRQAQNKVAVETELSDGSGRSKSLRPCWAV